MASSNGRNAEGAWLVRRVISTPALVADGQAVAVERDLEALDGVVAVKVNVRRHRIAVQYDASRMDYRTLSDSLTAQGLPPAANWWSRLKGGLYQFTDANTRENAKLPPPACCSKPPAQVPRKRKE